MHHSIHPIFLQMEADLNQLVKDLAVIPETDLMEKPAGGGWSVLEVIQHLVIVERASLAYVKKKSSYPEHFQKADWKNGARKLVLRFFLFAPFKFKAPAVVDATNFDPNADLDGLVENWRSSRLEMIEFLENVPDNYLDKLLFRHAIAGRLTLDAMLLFIRDHFKRHRRQIDRVLSVK